ncbi:Ig-like domain-containing protein, partial [Myxococcus sp. 1LA]
TLWVRAKDAAGNVDATPVHHTWTVDLTPPGTELFGTLPAAVNNANSVVLTFREQPAGDADEFECSLNGAAFSECESGDTFNTPGNNTYTFLVRAKDAAGNVDPTPASHTWRTDKTRPDTSLSTTVGTLSNALQALFTLTSSASDVAGFQCVLEESPGETPTPPAEPLWADCASSYLTPVLEDGAYRLWARARDTAGNVDNDPPHHTWTVDLRPPDTQIGLKPDILTNQLTATFTFSASEPNVGFECSYDGSDYFTCVSPYELPNDVFQFITEGEHHFLVRAIDAAGNHDVTPASHSWSVAVGEVHTYIEPLSLSEYTSETSARFRFTSNLSNVVYSCELDGVVRLECEDLEGAVATFEDLPEGAHTLSVVAAEGEFRDLSPALFHWVIDLTAPVAPSITTPSADGMYVKERAPSFQGLVPNDDSLVGGSVNVHRGTQLMAAVPIAAVGSVWNFTYPTDLPDGEYTLLFSFADRAGNVSASTSRQFIIDATRPVTTLTVFPDGLTNQPQATFEFTSNESESAFECSLNGAAFIACTSPHTVSVADASHVFVVRAIDRARNVADEVGSHPWRVDTVAPSTSIVEKPAVDTNASQADFLFESNEAPAWYECSLDGAPFVECSSPYSLSALAEGEHRLEVRARDEATNVDTSPEVHVWRVDMTPPLAPEITAPAQDAVVGSLTPTFQGRAEPGSQVVLFVDNLERGTAPVEPSGQWRLTLTTAISEGPHTVSALARDAAQNAGPQSQASAFTVDPSINIVREVSSRGGGLSCAAGGEGHVPLILLGWAGLVLVAARRRRV